MLGQVPRACMAADLHVGMEMQIAIEVLSHDDDHDYLVYVWEPATRPRAGRDDRRTRRRDSRRRHAPVGQVGQRLHRVRHGRGARPRWPTPGSTWHDIQYVAGADTIRNGYPGFIAGATFAQKLGWTGVRVSSSYAACASGAHGAAHGARQILAGFCDVALVDRRRHHAEGLLRAGRRRAHERPRLAALPPARRHQPHLLRAVRPPPHGRLRRHARRLRRRQGEELPPRRSRTRTPASARRTRAEDVLDSPVVADPLRLLDICATSDGAAAMIVSSLDFAAPQARHARRHAGE